MYVDPNLTEIIAILDASGSMKDCIDDVIGGYNSLIEKQREQPGECRVTLITFSNKMKILYEDVPIAEVKKLTRKQYSDDDMTALADAIGQTINRRGKHYASLPFNKRPGKIVVFISTDGQENHSKEFGIPQVREMIKVQTEQFQWNFVFSGANINSYDVGDSLAIGAGSTLNYGTSKVGIRSLYTGVSDKLSQLRAGHVQNMCFTQDEKAAIEQFASPQLSEIVGIPPAADPSAKAKITVWNDKVDVQTPLSSSGKNV